MRVDDLITKAVIFIGTKAEGHFIPVGTGFITWTPVSTDLAWQSIVTCKHVIDKIPGEVVYARINDKSGEAQLVGHPKKDWFYHPTNPRADVAIYPSHLPKDQFDITHLPINDFLPDARFLPDAGTVVNVTLNADSIARFNVGIGDEVYLAGLFIGRVGDIANIPILRTGTIAAMSGEKIETQYGRHEAFLVEVRSIDGLSGSPVCVHLPANRLFPPNVPIPASLSSVSSYLLMGMVLGYNEVYNPKDVIEIKGRTDDETTQRMRVPLNTGIAVVLPIWTIIEAMEQDAIKEKREAVLKRSNREKGRGFVATSAAPISLGKTSPDENPQHREDFTALLNAAARKREPKD
jgi:hypothetical protein